MRKALMGLVLVAVVALPAAPVQAQCDALEGQPLAFDATGTAGAVGPGDSHWYGFTATRMVMVTMQSFTGDADLHVYEVSGGSSCPVASSTNGSVFLDWVVLDVGRYNIEVRYYSSPVELVAYYVRVT